MFWIFRDIIVTHWSIVQCVTLMIRSFLEAFLLHSKSTSKFLQCDFSVLLFLFLKQLRAKRGCPERRGGAEQSGRSRLLSAQSPLRGQKLNTAAGP